MTTPAAGTVISGTHRHEDLIPALYAELERINPEAADRFSDALESFDGNVKRFGSYAEMPPEVQEPIDFFLEDLLDTLDAWAPEGLSFGAHPGTGLTSVEEVGQ